MLNEERIKLMTKMAIYEKREGKEMLPVGDYYKSDYVSLKMVTTGISITIAYILLVVLWGISKAEYLMANIHKIDLADLIKKIAAGYILLLLAYLLISFIVYMLKYRAAKKSLKKYYKQLKQLGELYEDEASVSDSLDETGGGPDHDEFTGV